MPLLPSTMAILVQAAGQLADSMLVMLCMHSYNKEALDNRKDQTFIRLKCQTMQPKN